MFIPFHIFNAIPRTISINRTLPKLSVMAAILLSGDKDISSPCLLLSGNPNLVESAVAGSIFGFFFALWLS